jgi:hypothetical protein
LRRVSASRLRADGIIERNDRKSNKKLDPIAGLAKPCGGMDGATDDSGFKAVDKPVHVHDSHATILCLMGVDHKEWPTGTAGATSG